jgi:CheY-like chemotaxis protein
MKCPKCKAAVTSAPDASGLIICAKCGARLRSRAGSETVAAPGVAAPLSGAETLPAGKMKVGRTGSETVPPAGNAAARPGSKTLASPGGVAPKTDAPAAEPAPSDMPLAPTWPSSVPPGLETLFEELRAMRVVQDEILALLKDRLAPGEAASAEDAVALSGPEDTDPPSATAVRSRRRKTVLLIDDDPSSRIAALQALEHAEVPTRTAQDGSAGLAAIAQEKPDVIVLELGIDGAMSGKDVVNMVKATMEWVDVPIVLYTRVPIESQKEARTIHGADELVQKGPDGANQLVARVIGLFRKG